MRKDAAQVGTTPPRCGGGPFLPDVSSPSSDRAAGGILVTDGPVSDPSAVHPREGAMTYSLGVDLGTSFIAAAVARPTGTAMVPLGDQAVVAPAVVAIRPDGSIVTGDAAERRAISQPAMVARSVKRRLGDAEPVWLGDASYPVATLLGAQLRDVVQTATDREGEPPERVVLAHPAAWTPARRGRFDEVARAAGIDAPRLVTAAEAVTHHAARGGTSDGRVVAVYDLGGGGFEATIVRTGPGGPEILGSPEGVEGFGGADLDEAILSYVDDAVGGALARLDMDDARTAVALARLRHDCVLAKENLSLDTETVVPVFLPGRHFEIRLNRTTFEQMLRSPLESTVDALSRAVHSAGLTPADVDAVLLVGGSTRIPMVAETVVRKFGRPLLEGVHPVHGVALGAAALAGVPAPAVPAAWGAAPVDVAALRAAAPRPDEAVAEAAEQPAAVAARNGAELRDREPAAPQRPTSGAPWFDANGPGADGPAPVVDLPRFSAPGGEERIGPDHRAGAPGPAPGSVPQAARPVAPPAAPRRRGHGSGVVIMAVGTVVAVLILVLVFVLAP
jgi:molecular chaperone DnaK (HSP70)